MEQLMDDAQGQSTQSPMAPVTGLNTNSGTVEDRISSFGESLLANIDQDRDPNQLREPQKDVEAKQEVATEEKPEGEATPETPADEATEELEEAEFEGKQYRVPKEIKRALLREADYTRKTQEVAESRKQLERITQASQQLFQQAQQFAPVFGQMHQLHQEIQQTQQRLTPDLEQNDPLAYLQLQTKLLTLSQHQQQVGAQLHHAGQHFTQQQTQLRAQALQAELPKLLKDIQGFEKPETRQALARWAHEHGASQSDLEAANWSPFILRTIHMAKEVETLKASNDKAIKSAQAKVVQAPTVKPTGRSQETPESQVRDLQGKWTKRGGSVFDPAFDALLRARNPGGIK